MHLQTAGRLIVLDEARANGGTRVGHWLILERSFMK